MPLVSMKVRVTEVSESVQEVPAEPDLFDSRKYIGLSRNKIKMRKFGSSQKA